jgi:hypothetical protein
MYQDSEVDKYYAPSLATTFAVRDLLFSSLLAILAIAAIVVPILIRFAGTSSGCYGE